MTEREKFSQPPHILALTQTVEEGNRIAKILAKENITTGIAQSPDDPNIRKKKRPDLVLLDTDEFSLYRFTTQNNKPFIAMSSILNPNYIADTLEAGAENFLPKPVAEDDLKFQTVSVLKRLLDPKNYNPFAEISFISQGGIVMNEGQRSVTVRGQQIDLTQKEYDLLKFFMLNRDVTLSKTQIFQSVWPYRGHYVKDYRSIDVYVSKLRDKIEEDRNNPKTLQTVHGVGYRFHPKTLPTDKQKT